MPSKRDYSSSEEEEEEEAVGSPQASPCPAPAPEKGKPAAKGAPAKASKPAAVKPASGKSAKAERLPLKTAKKELEDDDSADVDEEEGDEKKPPTPASPTKKRKVTAEPKNKNPAWSAAEDQIIIDDIVAGWKPNYDVLMSSLRAYHQRYKSGTVRSRKEINNRVNARIKKFMVAGQLAAATATAPSK